MQNAKELNTRNSWPVLINSVFKSRKRRSTYHVLRLSAPCCCNPKGEGWVYRLCRKLYFLQFQAIYGHKAMNAENAHLLLRLRPVRAYARIKVNFISLGSMYPIMIGCNLEHICVQILVTLAKWIHFEKKCTQCFDLTRKYQVIGCILCLLTNGQTNYYHCALQSLGNRSISPLFIHLVKNVMLASQERWYAINRSSWNRTRQLQRRGQNVTRINPI